MARHKKLSAADDENPGLDISSLIDVCFLLLIYFIVATELTSEKKLDMAMPSVQPAQNKEQVPLEPGLIRIENSGTIYWGAQENQVLIDDDLKNHNLGALVDQLKTLKAGAEATGGKPVVQLWVEGEVPHQRVVDVINALTEAGIQTVALTDVRDD